MNIPLDKQAHFLAGYAISLTVGLINPAIGLILSVVLGALKEWWWDKNHPLIHTVDVWDFIATASGGVFAYLVSFLLTII